MSSSSPPTPHPSEDEDQQQQNECLYVVCCANSLKTDDGGSCLTKCCCPCFISSKSPPQVYLEFSRILGNGVTQMVHRTEMVKKNTDRAEWHPFELTLEQLCEREGESRAFLIECFQEHRPNPKLLGFACTTVAKLQSMDEQKRVVQLLDEHGHQSKGHIHFSKLRVRQQLLEDEGSTGSEPTVRYEVSEQVSSTETHDKIEPHRPPDVPVPMSTISSSSSSSTNNNSRQPNQAPSRWGMRRGWFWSHIIYIDDEWGRVAFRADRKCFSMACCTWNLTLTNVRTGAKIGRITRKLGLGRAAFSISLGGAEYAVMKRDQTFFKPNFFKPRFLKSSFTIRTKRGTVKVSANWLSLAQEYTFRRGPRVVAIVSKEWFSTSYSVVVQPGENIIFILACCMVIDRCATMEKRRKGGGT